MLDDERIKEAESKVREYLNSGMMQKISQFRKEILDVYIRNCEESIDTAEFLFSKNKSNLWVLVASYYSMFYIANAVLYKIGYKIGDKICHKITSESLIVFIRNKLKNVLIEDYEEAKEEAMDLMRKKNADEIIESYGKELDKRSVFQYQTTEAVKKSKAETSLERAKRFVFEMKKLL